MSEKNPTYQIGAHDINQDTSLSGSESIQFDFENAAIFKRLADDIYESPEAGIREPLQNSLTAVKRAINQGHISKSEGVIEIEVTHGEQLNLVLKDNGIGISKDVLNEVLTFIGRSQNRDDGSVSGKYGMGFLACYKLVGSNGGFIMYTNSRNTNSKPINGIWKPGMFELDKENELPNKLDSNEFGTQFEFKLRKEIQIDDVREWIKIHSEWATIPIIYREFNENNELEYDDEYGIKNIRDEHTNANFKIEIDNEYYNAIYSSESDNRTILINSPLKRNSAYSPDNNILSKMSNIDIRLKNENGIVVKGPNKGLMPVSEAEYNQMAEERKENYISESELNLPNRDNKNIMQDNIDITLPEPTGTRDTLSRNSSFWSYLHHKLIEETKSKLTNILKTINTKEDFMNCSSEKQKFIYYAIKQLKLNSSGSKTLKSNFDSKLSIQISDELAKFYWNLNREVFYVKRDTPAKEAEKKEKNKTKTIGEIIPELNNSGRVFMGVSISNQSKMTAVWEENQYNIIVRVEKSDVYELFSELYNWKKLKRAKEHVDLDKLSENTQNILTTSKKKKSSSVKNVDVNKRKIVIHQHNKGTIKPTVQKIYDMYEEEDNEKLVLFLSNSDYNISDYYNITSENVSIAKSLVKIWDYLKSSKQIVTISNFITEIENMSFKTSTGIYTGEDIVNSQDNIILHINNEFTDLFKQDNILNEMSRLTQNESIKSKNCVLNDLDSYTYIPITPKELNYLKVLYNHYDADHNNVYKINSMNTTNIGKNTRINYENLYWYIWAKIPQWRGTSKIQALKNSSVTDSWLDIINDIDNKNINSTQYALPDTAKEMMYKTSEGEKSLHHIINTYDSIIAHVLKPPVAELFKKDDVITNLKEYVYYNELDIKSTFGRSNTENVRDNYNIENVIYVPLKKGELKDIEEIHTDKLHIIANRDTYYKNEGRIKNNFEAYSHSVLPTDVAHTITKNNNIQYLDNGGLELIENISELYK